MKLLNYGRSIALFCMPLMLGACASNSDLNRLQRQVNQVTNTTQTNQANSWSEIDSLRQEVAMLRGQLDDMKRGFEKAGGLQNMSDSVARHDRALRIVESRMAMDLQLGGDPSASGSEMSQQDTAPAPAAAPVPAAPAVRPEPPVQPRPVQPAQKPAQVSSGNMAQKLYDNGIDNFNKRKYQAAARSFDDLTKNYPKNKLAANAWFWKGESYYQMKNYAQAALAYQNVISGSPNSPKAPSSYFKQGMAFIQLNKNAAGRQRLNELIRKYPSSPEARRAKQVLDGKNI